MKLAVVGSRDFNDYELLKSEIDKIKNILNIDTIVSGGARGADTLAERYANEYNLGKLIFLPEWEKYGKRAGFIRNTIIWDHADAIIAFWDGVSKGTKHTVDKFSKNTDIPFFLIKY